MKQILTYIKSSTIYRDTVGINSNFLITIENYSYEIYNITHSNQECVIDIQLNNMYRFIYFHSSIVLYHKPTIEYIGYNYKICDGYNYDACYFTNGFYREKDKIVVKNTDSKYTVTSLLLAAYFVQLIDYI